MDHISDSAPDVTDCPQDCHCSLRFPRALMTETPSGPTAYGLDQMIRQAGGFVEKLIPTPISRLRNRSIGECENAGSSAVLLLLSVRLLPLV